MTHVLRQAHGRTGAAADGVLYALLLLFIAATRIFQPPVWIDDAFIHFRNARNFADGLGLVFNPGEWLIGSTSPVYVLVLGILSRVSGAPVPEMARGLNGILDLVSATLCLNLLARGGVPRLFRYAIVLVVFAEPMGMLYSAAGMEMSLFLAVSLLIIFCAERGAWLPAGMALGLLGWIRPEGATLGAAVLLAMAQARQNGPALKCAGVATLTALVAAGVLYFCYRTVLPQSLLAKASSPWFPTSGQQDALLFFEFLARVGPLHAILPGSAEAQSTADRSAFIVFAALQAGLMLVGGFYWRRKSPVAGTSLLAFAVLYYLFYALANPMLFEWYYVPWGFLGTLLGGMGLWAAIERGIDFAIAHGETSELQAPRWAAAAAMLTGAILLLAQSNNATATGHFERQGRFSRHAFRFEPLDPFDRLRLYEQAGKVMNTWHEALPGAVVATPEIGVFGWYYAGKILDPYALVSPEALDVLDSDVQAEFSEEIRGYHPVNVYLHHKPEFIMTAGLFLPYVPEAMAADYIELHRRDIPLLRVFMRRDLPDAVRRVAANTSP